MDYQTLKNEAASIFSDLCVWFTDDPVRLVYAVAGFAVLGAVRGVYRSLGYCQHTSHIGRRVL